MEINPIVIANEIVELRAESEKAESDLKLEIDNVMKSEKMVELSQKAEDSRLNYEVKKGVLLEQMIKNKITEIRTESGHIIKILTNGEKKNVKIILKK